LWNQALDDGRFGREFATKLEEQGRLNSGEVINHGRGLFIETYRGTKEVSHGGVTLGYVAFLARFPEHRVSVAVLCNGSWLDPSGLAHKVADQLLPEHLPPARTAARSDYRPARLAGSMSPRWAPSPTELEQLSGLYESDEALAVYLARIEDGRLVLQLRGQPGQKHILSPTYRDSFVFVGGSIKFQRNATGAVSSMTLSASRIRELSFERLLPVT
jgi:hypothetical protein